MKDFTILLSTINDVKEFVRIVAQHDYEVDLVSGRYAVDAKSIMGIFSLDLSRPIQMTVRDDNAEELIAAVERFIQK